MFVFARNLEFNAICTMRMRTSMRLCAFQLAWVDPLVTRKLLASAPVALTLYIEYTTSSTPQQPPPSPATSATSNERPSHSGQRPASSLSSSLDFISLGNFRLQWLPFPTTCAPRLTHLEPSSHLSFANLSQWRQHAPRKLLQLGFNAPHRLSMSRTQS